MHRRACPFLRACAASAGRRPTECRAPPQTEPSPVKDSQTHTPLPRRAGTKTAAGRPAFGCAARRAWCCGTPRTRGAWGRRPSGGAAGRGRREGGGRQSARPAGLCLWGRRRSGLLAGQSPSPAAPGPGTLARQQPLRPRQSPPTRPRPKQTRPRQPPNHPRLNLGLAAVEAAYSACFASAVASGLAAGGGAAASNLAGSVGIAAFCLWQAAAAAGKGEGEGGSPE